jgi:hypothetical protein
MKSINQNVFKVVGISFIVMLLLLTLKQCNSTVLEKYKADQLELLKKELRKKELGLLDSVYKLNSKYTILEVEKKRLDSLYKKSKLQIVKVVEKKETKLKYIATLQLDSQVILFKNNIGDSNVNVVENKLQFDTNKVALINTKFEESNLQKEELGVVYQALSLCDSTYQVQDTMIQNRNQTITVKDSTIAVNKELTQAEIDLRKNKEKELRKQKTNNLISMITVPTVTGALGFVVGFFTNKITK